MSIATFIPTIWSARLLNHLDNTLVAKALFNTDYEGEIKSKGDTVKINRVGNVTIKDYKKTDIDPPEDVSTEDAILTIDQQKYFNFMLDDIDKVQAAGNNVIDQALARAAYGLNDAEDKYLMGLLAAGAKGKLTGNEIKTARQAYQLLIELRTQLNKQSVPTQGRAAILPPELTGALLAEKFIVMPTQTGEKAMINGYVGRAIGFDIYESNNLTGTSETKKKIVAGHNMGATRAEQISEVEGYRPEGRFGDALKGLHVYGGKVTMPEALVMADVDFTNLFKEDTPTTEG